MHPVHQQLFSERLSKSPARMFKNYFLVICGSAFMWICGSPVNWNMMEY
jgi:hypothetical protein